MSIRAFLAKARTELKTKRSPLSIFLGNEAADADSIISALCLSFLHRNKPSTAVPLLSVPRAELLLRHDVDVLLRSVDCAIGELICIDDADFAGLHAARLLDSITLTDHNHLSPHVASLLSGGDAAAVYSKVAEILDHHVDAGEHAHVQGDRRAVEFSNDTGLALVGSTCTLVAERFFQAGDGAISSEIATLLLGVILLDTVNMDPAAGKVTARDQAAVDKLRPLSLCDAQSLFQRVSDAKLDLTFWRSLTAAQCLLLDYKRFETKTTRFGIASLLLPLPDFCIKDDMATAISDLFASGNIDMLALMFAFTEPPSPDASSSNAQPPRKLTRQLMTISRNAHMLRALNDFLVLPNPSPASPNLSPMPCPPLPSPSSAAVSAPTAAAPTTGSGVSNVNPCSVSAAASVPARDLDPLIHTGGASALPLDSVPATSQGDSHAVVKEANLSHASFLICDDKQNKDQAGGQFAVYCYAQGNVKASRKQIAPLLSTFFAAYRE